MTSWGGGRLRWLREAFDLSGSSNRCLAPPLRRWTLFARAAATVSTHHAAPAPGPIERYLRQCCPSSSPASFLSASLSIDQRRSSRWSSGSARREGLRSGCGRRGRAAGSGSRDHVRKRRMPGRRCADRGKHRRGSASIRTLSAQCEHLACATARSWPSSRFAGGRRWAREFWFEGAVVPSNRDFSVAAQGSRLSGGAGRPAGGALTRRWQIGNPSLPPVPSSSMRIATRLTRS